MGAKTDIKFFVHTNNNAPQLQNAFGSMINVLDAALVNGIQVGTVSSLTASGKIVTAVFGTAHNLMPYQVVKIAGANQAEYNGEYRILSVPNATTLTFELAEVPSTTIATGTINCSLPPLGWEKPFSSSNPNGGGKAAYRSKNLMLSSRPFLRVVDEPDPAYNTAYAKFAKVGIVEDMSDIDTMLGHQAPFDQLNPDKNWVATGSGNTVINGWSRWYYAHNTHFGNSTANDTSTVAAGSRNWIVIGTSGYFYILPCGTPTNGTGALNALPYGFGAFESFLNADLSNTFLSSTFNNNTANSSTNKQGQTGLVGTANSQRVVILRGYQQTTSHAEASTASIAVSTTMHTGSSNYVGAASLTGITPFGSVYLNEAAFRGKLHGVFWVFQNKPFENLQIIERDGEYYIAVNIGSSGTGTSGEGQIVFKIGGSDEN